MPFCSDILDKDLSSLTSHWDTVAPVLLKWRRLHRRGGFPLRWEVHCILICCHKNGSCSPFWPFRKVCPFEGRLSRGVKGSAVSLVAAGLPPRPVWNSGMGMSATSHGCRRLLSTNDSLSGPRHSRLPHITFAYDSLIKHVDGSESNWI